jgi:transcriptional regulator with XRE-family HTH domain
MNIKLTEQIKKIKQARKITYERLAAELGISLPTSWRLLNGITSWPTKLTWQSMERWERKWRRVLVEKSGEVQAPENLGGTVFPDSVPPKL